MQKKYELLPDDTVTTPCGKTLYRICALRDIRENVKKGDSTRWQCVDIL